MKTGSIAATRRGRTLLTLVAAAACVSVGIIDLPAQTPKASAKKPAGGEVGKDEADGQGFLVIPLKYAEATQIQNVLKQLPSDRTGVSVVANNSTNSLIVRAMSPESLETIASLVKKLDVPPQPAEKSLQTKIFRPRSMTLDNLVSQQLRVAISEQGRMAIDENRNVMVVQDTEESLAAIGALFQALDEGAPDRPNPKILRLRVVWLISGMDRRDAVAPPADLKSVTSDLAKIGVEGLQVTAQAIVNTGANDRFQVQCSPELDSPCDLTVSGRFSTSQEKTLNLQIQIGATERGRLLPGKDERGYSPNQTLCSLNTTIVTPLGHSVVLGSAPVGKLTFVFVVQVTAGD